MLKRFPTALAVSAGLFLFCPPAGAQSPSTSDQTASTEQSTAESKADPGTAAPDQATDQPPIVRKVRNNTQDDFYGLGMDSTDATRVDYGIRSTDLSTGAAVHVTPWLRLGADVGYLVPSVRHGRDDNLRTIETIFTDATAPGLAEQPDFVHDSVFAELDSRDAHGFPRRGGFYRASYALWNDRTLEQYNFRRSDIVGSHFISVARNDVVALRLGLSYANNAPGDRVPFYMLPYVGGGDTIRSFREFRFRDENAGVVNAEFRHKVHSMAHVAGFVDFGK